MTVGAPPGYMIFMIVSLDAATVPVAREEIELAKSVALYSTRSQIEKLEAVMLEYEQVEAPVIHRFCDDGTYMRQVTLPRKTFAIGHEHTRDCFNVILEGSASVLIEGRVKRIVGPDVFVGKAGERKVGFIHEETVWLTVHATTERDLAALEEQLLVKSPAFKAFEQRVKEGAVVRRMGNPFSQGYLQDRADYQRAIADLGRTHVQVRAIVENEVDQIPMPEGAGLKMIVAPSKIDGLGIFATAGIEPGEMIAPARIKTMRTPAGRYTNHALYPNAFMQVNDCDIHLVADRPIHRGEEITVNYREARQTAEKLDGRPLRISA